MMGQRKQQDSFFNYKVNLDKRVRKDNPLRKIDELIDFSFVRDEVRHTYGEVGNPSVDPEVIMRMMFLLFFDNVASERKLMEIISERLDYMWFLGYGLDDDIPDHSVLSKARRRWGPEIFKRLFVETVRQCVCAGLVDGSKLHVDGSLIDADASTDSVRKGPPELIAALKAAYLREEAKLDDSDEDGGPKGGGSGGGGSDVPSPKKYYRPKNKGMMSTTDPDSAMISRRGLGSRPRYKNHRAVDDHCGVVTALVTTPGDVEENSKLFELLDLSESITGLKVLTAVADAQYGTADNFRECALRGIRAHMADLSEKHKNTGRKKGIFPDTDFIYDPASDTYTCPAGNVMRKRRYHQVRRSYEYVAGSKVCNSCKIRGQCTRAKLGRSIKRHEGHDLIEAARAQSHSPAAKRDRARRKPIGEGSFADAKNLHGFKRSRWRRLWRQLIQDYLIAACQNIRKLISNNVPSPRKTGIIAKNDLIRGRFRLFFACSPSPEF